MTSVRRSSPAALALAAACTLAACGSTTKTVTLRAAPTPAQSTSPSTPAPSTGSATGGGTAAPSGGTSTSTRTAPEPAFTNTPSQGEGLSGAIALLRERGYTARNGGDYHPSQTLRVLIGSRVGAGGAPVDQAFFFVNGRYIGTDAKQPSVDVKVVAQADTQITLAYSLYRRGDPPCCPRAGQARVRFVLDNGKLVALDAIPTASASAPVSRD
jgi:LppP/LprE lipoprotein